MKRKWVWGLVIIILIIIIFSSLSKNKEPEKSQEIIKVTPTGTQKESGQNKFLVTKVTDGDTVVVNIDGKEKSVRLIGIDAPELKEDLGIEAKNKLKELIENKEVFLENDESQEDQDIYGRILRYIFINNELVNQKMIEDGWAKEYTYKKAYKNQQEFKTAETQAKEKNLGIWKKNQEKVKGVNTQQNTDFICDCSKTCVQIGNCDEVYYQLQNCECSKRDSDGDGVPCESLCR